MKKILLLSLFSFCGFALAQNNVGIGTTTPHASAQLHVELGTSTTKGLLVRGTTFIIPSTIPDLGGGSRMMFYPGKAAFRAGYVTGSEWNNSNVGYFSSAIGRNTIANGYNSTAMGDLATASGSVSTAIGYNTIASGDHSIAIGYETSASGISSSAIGRNTAARGFVSTAMGYNTIASGYSTVAMGSNVSTNGHGGAFFFGDSDPHVKGMKYSDMNNEFAARFNGGYYFISSDAGADIGVRVLPGSNSWSAISDARRKENFLPVDGEDVLRQIASMPQYTWNYKGQDVKTLRHYGPMAQDFHQAFGKDKYGTIGCDTLINQQDFLGVNLIAIQALERRTQALQKENNELKARLDRMEKILATKQQ